MKQRKFWGWGYADQVLTEEEEQAVENRILKNFNLSEVDVLPIPSASEIDLRKPRINLPGSLKSLFSTSIIQILNTNSLIYRLFDIFI